MSEDSGRHGSPRFRGSITYNAEAVRRMERIRHRTFDLLPSAVRILCGGIMVVCGYLTGGIAGILFVAFGCILAVSGDVTGRWRCEQTIKALQGRSIDVAYEFHAAGFDTIAGKEIQHCEYSALICLMEDREHYYLFPNEYQSFMIARASLIPQQEEVFKMLLAQEAGLEWIRPLSLLTANLKQIIRFQKAVGKKTR